MNPAPPRWGLGRPLRRCPWCAQHQDALTGLRTNQPKPGDYCMCWDCKRLAVFDDDLQLRRPTEQEARKIAGDPRLRRLAETARGADTPEQALDMTRGSPAKDEP